MFFFFKQKTAYEMRISDWSSDVCSSDLAGPHRDPDDFGQPQRRRRPIGRQARATADRRRPYSRRARAHQGRDRPDRFAPSGLDRSEEHTSELQSLMRISYAVFCLKTKQLTIQKIIT